jgi:succinate-semialdehyde dehydrogenase/glutarate-semialdehyde dehydrogenase
LRPVALELGSIAATIVCDDADLERAAPRCANSAFRRAGQSCTSTQRLLVDNRVFDRFLDLFVEATRRLRVGDPRDPETHVGPLISEEDARRAERWVEEAVAAGARVVEGGKRAGALLHPTILVNVQSSMRVVAGEVFAPVVSVLPFGGVKDSGLGREGPKYAMQEMTEERLITISLD